MGQVRKEATHALEKPTQGRHRGQQRVERRAARRRSAARCALRRCSWRFRRRSLERAHRQCGDHHHHHHRRRHNTIIHIYQAISGGLTQHDVDEVAEASNGVCERPGDTSGGGGAARRLEGSGQSQHTQSHPHTDPSATRAAAANASANTSAQRTNQIKFESKQQSRRRRSRRSTAASARSTAASRCVGRVIDDAPLPCLQRLRRLPFIECDILILH